MIIINTRPMYRKLLRLVKSEKTKDINAGTYYNYNLVKNYFYVYKN